MTERLRRMLPGALDAEQRRLYDRVLGGPRASTARVVELTDADGGLYGPFNAWLLSPNFGSAIESLGAAIRFAAVFDARLRELAILSVANDADSEFELYAHEALGRAAGLTDAELAALRAGTVPESCSPDERLALELVTELRRTGDLSDESHRRAVARFGERGLFELVTLVGFYSMLALQLRVYRTPPP